MRPLSRAGWILAALFFAALLTARIVAVFHYHVDSDEPQHLHVVWGWANGMLQYRDLFDNHSPLFQMLCAPIFKLFGERADIIVPMRLLMLPLFAVDLWFVFLLASRVFRETRAALWATALTAFFPKFFLPTTEFRTDDLWVLLWLASLVIVTGGKFSGRRAFFFGLTMGAAFATSMKTSLLLFCLSLAGLVIVCLRRFVLKRDALALSEIVKSCALAAVGMLIVPAALVAFFASKGALHAMIYCVIEHNNVPGLGKWRKPGFHQYLFAIWFPVFVALAWLALRRSRDERDARSGAALALFVITGGSFYMALRSFWPLVTAQDFAPPAPLIMIAVTVCLFWIGRFAARLHPSLIYVLPVLILCVECRLIFARGAFSRHDVDHSIEHLAEMLRLTDPGDYVMDAKGESIFRKRAYYWVLEGITITRIKHGILPTDLCASNDLRECLVKTKTCALYEHRIPEADRQWVRDNYIYGRGVVLVAGKQLGVVAPGAHSFFETTIPANYAIVAQNRTPVSGVLDGKPLAASQFLAPGQHDLQIAAGGGQLAVVWTQAVERGFEPKFR